MSDRVLVYQTASSSCTPNHWHSSCLLWIPTPWGICFFLLFFLNIYFEVGKCLGGKWFFLQSKTELFRFLISGDCAEEGWMIFFRWGLTWRIEILKTCEMARKRARLSSPRGQSLFPPIKIRLCHWRRDYSTPKKKEEKKKRHSFLKRKAVSCWTAAQLPSSETENRERMRREKDSTPSISYLSTSPSIS